MVAASSMSATVAIKTGKVRALATLGLTRVPSMPDLPTVAEQGFPGFKITNRYGLHVPAGTPRPIITAINRVISDGMHSPQMRQKLSPATFTALQLLQRTVTARARPPFPQLPCASS